MLLTNVKAPGPLVYLVYIEFKMTVNQPLFTSIGLKSSKRCQIGRLIGIINFDGGLQSLTDSSSHLTLRLSLLDLA